MSANAVLGNDGVEHCFAGFVVGKRQPELMAFAVLKNEDIIHSGDLDCGLRRRKPSRLEV